MENRNFASEKLNDCSRHSFQVENNTLRIENLSLDELKRLSDRVNQKIRNQKYRELQQCFQHAISESECN